MSEDEKKKYGKIKTQFLENKQMWTAFITHQGYDYYELGETEAMAIHLLITRHPQLAPFKP